MNAVGYSSPFVPAEWIAAHGLRPERLRLHPSERLTRGICPYAGGAAGCGPRLWGMVRHRGLGGTGDRVRSDAMRAPRCWSSGAIGPVFLLNVPSTWQTPAARQLYLDELRRLGRFLAGPWAERRLAVKS